ncbi:MAG: hypothetical protein Q7J38_06385 [Gallionella sp.]|nr:hypothetical protein [Gallionella sp.]
MLFCNRNVLGMIIAVVLAMNGTMSIARAEALYDESFQPANATYKRECSSCHNLYSPKHLRALSWRKVMANLNKHYGTDASVTDQDTKEITEYLVHHARTHWQPPFWAPDDSR